MPAYLTPAQYAERYGVNACSVRRMCARGELPAVKVGSAWRIEDGEADAVPADALRKIDEMYEWSRSVSAALASLSDAVAAMPAIREGGDA